MSIYDNTKARKRKIAEWEQRGNQWCAEQLWLARKAAYGQAETIGKLSSSLHETEARADALAETNEILSLVLKENGIRTHKLIITYEEGRCLADLAGTGECDEWDCDYCPKWQQALKIRTVGFYIWELTEDVLQGITADFKKEGFDVVRIIDDETRRLLWERQEDEG